MGKCINKWRPRSLSHFRSPRCRLGSASKVSYTIRYFPPIKALFPAQVSVGIHMESCNNFNVHNQHDLNDFLHMKNKSIISRTKTAQFFCKMIQNLTYAAPCVAYYVSHFGYASVQQIHPVSEMLLFSVLEIYLCLLMAKM